jgi:aminomethyltransferase
VSEDKFFWTAADPQYRWLTLNARGLDVEIEDVTEAIAAVALQGPLARAVLEEATEEPFGELRYFRRRSANLVGATFEGGVEPANLPIEVSRTGYTGDLGYEIWVAADRAADAWDALMAAGRGYGIRPAGMLALDVVRLEAGLVLLEVDYTSARHALNPEQNYSPFELGLGRLVDFVGGDFVGRLALQREQARGGPARRLVGVQLDWHQIEAAFSRQGLAPAISASIDRSPVPVFGPRGDRQVGKLTSHGWSPILKQAIGLASVSPQYEALGTKLAVEWTVEGHRGRVDATVVPMPFLDLPRKRA